MKKLVLALLGGLLLNSGVFAQLGNTTQRGRATRELTYEGFCAAHGSFPLGSTIRVVNTATREEINVTIVNRIRLSPERIVDLSPDAWNALGLTPDTVVMLVYAPAPAPVARPNPPAEPQITPGPEEIATEKEPLQAQKETAAEKEPPQARNEAVVEREPLLVREKVAGERESNEIARLKSTQTLYHLLLLDRRQCVPGSDISEVQSVNLLYKFLHEQKGYLVAVYSSSKEGPVFPVMPNNARILVDIITTDKTFLRDYINSAAFKRFVTNPQVVSQLQRVLR